MHLTKTFGADPTFILTKEEARALCEFSSNDPTRLTLNSILLDAARGAAVATDGHRLARVLTAPGEKNDPNVSPETAPAMLPRDALLAAIKRTGRTESIAVTLLPDQQLAVGTLGECPLAQPPTAVVTVAARDAQFPPYEQVIPTTGDYTPCPAWGMAAEYLSAVKLVAAATCSPSGGVVVYPPANVLDPIRIEANGPALSAWTVVIMPMRVDDEVAFAKTSDAAFAARAAVAAPYEQARAKARREAEEAEEKRLQATAPKRSAGGRYR
jgi:hypothetical protein